MGVISMFSHKYWKGIVTDLTIFLVSTASKISQHDTFPIFVLEHTDDSHKDTAEVFSVHSSIQYRTILGSERNSDFAIQYPVLVPIAPSGRPFLVSPHI
jgi:hypothetical protein